MPENCPVVDVFPSDECIDNSLSVKAISDLCESNVCELNAVSYVAGYVAKQILSRHDCCLCREMLLSLNDTVTEGVSTRSSQWLRTQ